MPGAAITAFFLDNEDWSSPFGTPVIKAGFVVYRINVTAGNVVREDTVEVGDIPTGEPC